MEKEGKISYLFCLNKCKELGVEDEFKVSQKWNQCYSVGKGLHSYFDWFNSAVLHCRPTLMIVIIDMFLKEKGAVLADLKNIINSSFIILNLCENLNKIVTDLPIEISYDIMVCYTPEIFSNLLERLLYLGAIYSTESFIYILEDKFFDPYKEAIFKAITRYEAALKIVKAVENAMDDEYYLTGLRKKIELRRFLKLMEERNS